MFCACRGYCQYQSIKATMHRQQAEAAIRQKLYTEGTKHDPVFKEV